MDDAHEAHEMDQLQGKMREYATSLARDVVAYRGALIDGGVPEVLADTMAERFNASWLAAQVEANAGVGVTTVYVGMGDDDDV